MTIDLMTLLKVLDAIVSIMASISGFVAWLFSFFGALGIGYLSSSILVGLTFLTGFYIAFIFLKILTKIAIFAFTLGFIFVFLGALFGLI